MRNPNGQSTDVISTSEDTRHVSEISKQQYEFLEYIQFHGVMEFVQSLKLMHDIALYHSDVSFNQEEKKALYDLKILWEGFEQME